MAAKPARDAIDRRIVRLLAADGRSSCQAIAEDLD